MKKSTFWQDFNKVKSTIENPLNKVMHIPAIEKLIKAMEDKYCYNQFVGLYDIPKCYIVFPFYDDLKKLKIKLQNNKAQAGE